MHYEKLFKILKPTVYIICLIVLSIATYDIYKDYKDYQTVVTVHIMGHQRSLVSFPGISVCEGHHFFKLKDETWFKQKIMPVYKGNWMRGKQKESNLDFIKNQAISGDHYVRLFMDYDIQLKDTFGPVHDGFITCINKQTNKPCYPVNLLNGYFSECVTFFNTIHYVNGSSMVLPKQLFAIRDNARDNEMAEIQIKKNQSNDYHTNQVTVIAIPTDSIPVFSKQKLAFRQDLLKFGRRYDVTFTKTTIKKLPQPYKPYCRNYQSTDYVKSFHDCHTRCIHRIMFQTFNCSMAGIDVILNQEFSEKRMCKKNDLDKFDVIWFLEVYSSCGNEVCLPSCNQEIYNYETTDVTESPSFINDRPSNDTIIIKILPDDEEEFLYVHQPKISTNDLLSKLGGLLSFWLGFSFFSMYNQIEKVIKSHLANRVIDLVIKLCNFC